MTPPARRSDIIAAVMIALAIALVTAVRSAGFQPGDGVSLLYAVPVSIAAVRFGWAGGLVAGTASGMLLLAWAAWHPDVQWTARSLALPLASLALAGFIAGRIATRRQSVERLVAVRLRRMLLELQSAREDERAAIAGDLHDFALQDLAATVMQAHAAIADARAAGEVSVPLERVEGLSRLAQAAHTSLRRTLAGVQPIDLDAISLADAIHAVISEVEHTYEVPVGAALDIRNEPHSHDKVTIYRLVAELLRNAGKHANARHVALELRVDERRAQGTIADDGRGLAAPAAPRNGAHPQGLGMGLALLLERVVALDGRYDVRSWPGRGTRVSFDIPLPPDDPSGNRGRNGDRDGDGLP